MIKNVIIILSLFGCAYPQQDNMNQDKATSDLRKEKFGVLPDGTEIDAYILTSPNGSKMKIITYGGIITHLEVPDKNGKIEDIVLGYNSLQGYLNNSPYFGAIIGRYGNRIAKGKFTLNGNEYILVRNNGENHLHGGEKGFDKRVWTVEDTFQTRDIVGLKLKYISPDEEEGYPGTLTSFVTYSFSDDGLDIAYEATTDKPTIVNLTHHSYFNLSGNVKEDILNHKLKINAGHFLPVDSTSIPTGDIRPVEGTPFDFTSPKKIGQEINVNNKQLENANGYDHNWVLNGEGMKKAASLYHSESGRYMEVYTTEPGLQFYSGNFLNGSITGKNNVVYRYRYGLALETQHFPDSPNQNNFPSVVLNPGEKYTSQTSYKFSTR
ncbi:MAG: aldose epimerase family protein [Candidatus Cyclobacteriaceae bacterium M2_1C_046]